MLLLFGASTSLILLSAKITRNIDAASTIEENDRLIRLYFNQVFRQNNASIQIEKGERISIDLEAYIILIYAENGQLIEQNAQSNEILEGAGQAIAKLDHLQIKASDQQWLVSYENLDQKTINLVFLRNPS
jgi:hypothetical protein